MLGRRQTWFRTMNEMLKPFIRTTALIVTVVVVALACCFSASYLLCLSLLHPPLICRSSDELFYIEPEILQTVQPHLADWATRSPDETESEREEVGKELGVNIDVFEWHETATGKSVTVVGVSIETYYDWTRGFLYVDDGTELLGEYEYLLRRIDEHVFAYNTNN